MSGRACTFWAWKCLIYSLWLKTGWNGLWTGKESSIPVKTDTHTHRHTHMHGQSGILSLATVRRTSARQLLDTYLYMCYNYALSWGLVWKLSPEYDKTYESCFITSWSAVELIKTEPYVCVYGFVRPTLCTCRWKLVVALQQWNRISSGTNFKNITQV